MTSLSSRRDYHVEHFPSGLMCNNLEHEFARTWKEDRTPSSPSETSSNSAMMQKASQHRFFVWVATTRLKLDPIRRYKCPMIGCEFQFESLEMMLQHLPLCTRLAQGVYYCVESGRNERVGKCSSPGCRDLKGRLTTVVNSSFNSVKRCLSGRSSKSQQHAEPMSLQNGEQLPHNEIVSRAEMGGDYFYPPEPTQLSELPTRYNKATGSFPRSSLEYNQEQTRNFIRGQYHELDSYGNLSRPLIYSAKQQEQSCAELDNSTSTSPPPSYAPTSERISSSLNALETWIYGSKKASSPQSGQSGSYVNEDDTWTYDPVFQHASSTSEFSNACDERHVDSIHSKTASSINGVPHLADNLQTYLGQNQNQISQVPSPYPEDKIVMEGLSVSMSQSPNQCWQYSPRTYSGTDSQLSERRSVFSSAASMSTRDSSMSSNDSRNAVVDSGQHTSTSFFGEETEMMSEEPDFMDESESMMPSPLRLPENNRQHIHTVNALESDANGVSIDDYAQPGSYLLGYDTQQVKYSTQTQTPRATTYSSLETAEMEATQKNTPPIVPPTTVSQQFRRQTTRRTACTFCKIEPRDASNILRHEKTCKINPNRVKGKPFKCTYPNCQSAYTRPDNLLLHQKRLGHLGSFEMCVKFTPMPMSSGVIMALDELERQTRVERAGIFQ